MNGKGNEAHIAVIDASTNLPKANLKIRDLPTKEKNEKKKPREEELIFNRIYALDSGNYEMSVDQKSSQNLALESKKDYVVLRTGDGEDHETLVAFPHDQPHSSAKAGLPTVLVLLCTLQILF